MDDVDFCTAPSPVVVGSDKSRLGITTLQPYSLIHPIQCTHLIVFSSDTLLQQSALFTMILLLL